MHLIISKEKEDIQRTLEGLLRECSFPISHFYPETFTPDRFFQEVETPPFLSSGKALIIHTIDHMSEEMRKMVIRYIEKPSPWVALYVTAYDLSPQHQLVQLLRERGKIYSFKEEKPWEKEKRVIHWLIDEAQREGCELSMEAAVALAREIDHSMLSQELLKLICFAGGEGKIDLEDIRLLCTSAHHETLWQLGEAMMRRELAKALKIGQILLQEGISLFPLLAHLLSQFQTAVEILRSQERGDLAHRFPYLKGQLLEKKLKMLKKLGIERLQKGTLIIFETEIKAKNSSISSAEPSLLLEMLLVQYDALSAA